MSNPTNLDEVRRHALDIVDKSERRWKRAIFIFAAVEGVGWITFIVVAWLGFSIAILLGVAVLILYTMIFSLGGRTEGAHGHLHATNSQGYRSHVLRAARETRLSRLSVLAN